MTEIQFRYYIFVKVLFKTAIAQLAAGKHSDYDKERLAQCVARLSQPRTDVMDVAALTALLAHGTGPQDFHGTTHALSLIQGLVFRCSGLTIAAF